MRPRSPTPASPTGRWKYAAGSSSIARLSSSSLLSPAFLRLYASVCLAAMAPNLFVVAPRFLRELGFEEQAIGWVGGASPLASLVAMNVWARLAERAAGKR